MLSAGAPPDWTRVEVAVPNPPARLPGVTMAGFRTRLLEPVDMAVVPHPAVTVLIDLGDDGGLFRATAGRDRPGSFVAGLLPGELHARGRVGDCLQVRLSPVAAASVLGAGIELSGASASLEEVWGADAERLRDRLRATVSWDDRFTIMADSVRARLDTRLAVDPEVAYVWRHTAARCGRVRIADLAEEIGWSRKRLWARHRAQLGITPKQAARLIRFDRAAHLPAAGRSPASVAAASGYVDQSHLHHETRALAGGTPSEVAAASWLVVDPVAWPRTSRGVRER